MHAQNLIHQRFKIPRQKSKQNLTIKTLFLAPLKFTIYCLLKGEASSSKDTE